MANELSANNLSANVLLAHGSRDPQWQAPFEAIAENDQKKGSRKLERR